MIWSGIEFGFGVMVAWLVLGTAVSLVWVSCFSFSRSEAARKAAVAASSERQFDRRRRARVLRMSAPARYR